MTFNILIICPNCDESENTETYSDAETDEIFHVCNTCEFHWNEGQGEKQWFQ